jgi:hypothetical protein
MSAAMPVLPARYFGFAEACWRAFRLPRGVALVAEFPGVLLLFTIVTAAVFRRWLPHLGEALIGPPEDNLQDLWNTWYVAAGRHPGQAFFFTDLLRFPEGASLYLHSFAYPKVFAIALLASIVGTDMGTLVLIQNLSILASFPLAAAGAFLIARHLTASRAGALLGGFVFAFNPSHVEHAMHHVGVSSLEAIPFFVLCYLLATERRSPAFLLLAIGFYALSALSSWYYLVYLACFIAFHAVYAAVHERRPPGGWRLAVAVACPVAVVAILAPVLVPMTHAAAEVALPSADGAGLYAADLAGLAAFPRFHAFAPLADGVYRELKGNAWEATVYLGLASLALLSWACLSRRARPAPVLTYALCGMGTFCILAAGSRLQVLGHETIPLPGAALASLPLLSLMQAPARAIVLVYLFMAIAVAEAARAIWQQGTGLRRAAMAGLAAAIVLDYLPVRALALTPLSCPPSLDAIRDDPETGFGVLDLPPHGYAERNFYIVQQICHGRPIVLGNTSRRAGPTLGDRLDTWTVEAQRAQLIAARIKYVVLRSQSDADRGPARLRAQTEERLRFAWGPKDAPPAHYAAVYRLVYESTDLAIFRVY